MTAAAMYPWLLASTVNPAFDIDVHNALAGELGLHAGLGWWVLAIALAIGYFAFLFRAFRGKVRLDDGYGH
jgi:cytochrome d ubiquinol oxidase subunit II